MIILLINTEGDHESGLEKLTAGGRFPILPPKNTATRNAG
jgi:hypothetical protein